MKKLYTTREVAEILGYHPAHVRRLMREGKLNRANSIGHPRFSDENIKEFLERGKNND